MTKLKNSFDGEKHRYHNVFLFLIFCFPIQYGLILFSNQYKGNNYVDLHPRMYFRLSFTFDFYSYYYYTLCMFVNNLLSIEFKNKTLS
jgi:hypothetical protein